MPQKPAEFRSLAIERRMAGDPPASLRDEEAGESKAITGAPSNKMEPKPDNKALTSMTKAELLEEAGRLGVDVETDDNKADLVRKIEKARKE